MLKINFAVWNMQGTNKNDQQFTAHRKKINKLLEYKINGKVTTSATRIPSATSASVPRRGFRLPTLKRW